MVEEKETPATKHSRLKKRRPNNRQVVEDTSEEGGGGRPLSLPPYPLMDYEGGAGEREPTENPNRLTDPFIHTRFIRVGDEIIK